MITAIQAPGEAGNLSQRDLVESCYVRTAEALSASGAASDGDLYKALAKVREGQAKGAPLDMLETLARVMGHDEEMLGGVVHSLSDSVASTLSPVPASIPFASKLIAPSAFYESYDHVHQLGRLLLAPVLFVEDSDAIGTGSINPIAAQLLATQIHQAVSKRSGIRPFMTATRMEYESWAFLCRKHFEL